MADTAFLTTKVNAHAHGQYKLTTGAIQMKVNHFDHLRAYGFKPTPEELTAWWGSLHMTKAMEEYEQNPQLDNRVTTYQRAKKDFLLTLRRKA